MNQIDLDKKAAYVLGAYHALYEYFQHNPFMDKYYNEYKQGFDDVIQGIEKDDLKVFL
jgi:hypothetical protein